MKEILDIIAESAYTGIVEITSDSCYSGYLCHAAKKYVTDEETRNKLKVESFKIMASCFKDTKSMWGEYRKYKSSVRELGLRPDEKEQLKKKYTD